MYDVMTPSAFILIAASIVGSSSNFVTTKVKSDEPTFKNVPNNHSTYVNVTEEITKPSVFRLTQNSTSNEYVDFKNTTDRTLHNQTFSQSSEFEKVNESHLEITEAPVDKIGHNKSFLEENKTQIPNVHLASNTKSRNTEQTNRDYILTAETLTTPGLSEQKKVLLSKGILYPNIPYHIQSGAGRIHTLTLDRKKIPLQHHLQLVPMEDEPLGSMMLKDQRYLISVLVPIGMGMIGAAMIVVTVFTLRYVARKRALQSPLDNSSEVDGSNTPCISSISTETTDKMFLLLGDDEI